MNKFVTTALVSLSIVGVAAAPASATPTSEPGDGHEAAVHNVMANTNACWGQDRSFYASGHFFDGNMDIKQSFPSDQGRVGEQHAAWVARFCEAHGPTS